jgi:predicted metal-dependent HD superfamily phosphohydrolase
MATDEEATRIAVRAWERLWRPTDLGRMRPALDALLAAYSDPRRHYHNLRHIVDCQREFEPMREACERPDAVAAALLYHDVVYDPARGDNEERSAEVAAEALRGAGRPPGWIHTVRELILATRHTAPPATPDAAVVVDIDLSILGQPPDRFDEYERAIRLEYAHVPDAAFAAGRAKVLRQFLDRATVYATDHFRSRYEQPARRNLQFSLARLGAEGAG